MDHAEAMRVAQRVGHFPGDLEGVVQGQLLFLGSRLLKRKPPAEAGALISEAARLAHQGGVEAPAAHVPRSRRSALELVLAALSSTPATPEELDHIRQLLDEHKGRTPG